MNVFGIGLPEMALIMIVALLIFGPKKLPEIGRSMGKAIRGFQQASKEFENEFKREAEQLEKSMNPPMEAKLEEQPRKALQESQNHQTAEAKQQTEPAADTEVASNQEASSQASAEDGSAAAPVPQAESQPEETVTPSTST
jgi:sec-independent protein translocase protein TatA